MIEMNWRFFWAVIVAFLGFCWLISYSFDEMKCPDGKIRTTTLGRFPGAYSPKLEFSCEDK